MAMGILVFATVFVTGVLVGFFLYFKHDDD